MYDVIVVGAGPSGSYAASRLACLGYNVVVLDKKSKAGDHVCCTGIISIDCFNTFQLDATIFTQASSAKFFAPSGEFIRLERKTPQAYIVDRASLDRGLEKRAQEHGAKYLFRAPVVAISLEPDCVSVTVDYQGEQRIFTAYAAVLACGFGPKLPKELGLGEIANFVFGAQSEVNTVNTDEVEVYFDQSLFPGFFGWLVPTKDGRGLAGLLAQKTPAVYLKKLLSLLQSQGKITSVGDTCFGTIPLRTLARTHSDRIVVIGDAAGQVKPTTGGGIYHGLLCADMAVDCLQQAFMSNDFSATRLSSYERQWRAKLGSELQTGYWARRFYHKLNNRRIEHLFQAARDNGIPELIAETQDFSFDWHRPIIIKMLQKLAFSLPFRPIRHLTSSQDR